jgi:hypothetical protein
VRITIICGLIKCKLIDWSRKKYILTAEKMKNRFDEIEDLYAELRTKLRDLPKHIDELVGKKFKFIETPGHDVEYCRGFVGTITGVILNTNPAGSPITLYVEPKIVQGIGNLYLGGDISSQHPWKLKIIPQSVSLDINMDISGELILF